MGVAFVTGEWKTRAQAIINRQTLDKCDLLVGVFGTRIGSETGEYSSGTVEEIERHSDSGKPAMLYFSKQLGNSDDFEPEQYAKLEELKKDYKNRGLCESYDSDSDFKEKFARQLRLKINEHAIFQIRDQGIDLSALEKRKPEDDIIRQLRKEAKTLLKKASQDRDGEVTLYKVLLSGSFQIYTNGEEMMPYPRTGRVNARWKATLKELEDMDLLLEGRKRKRQASITTEFQLTDKGYKVADKLDKPE